MRLKTNIDREFKNFQKSIKLATKEVDDLSVPLNEIATRFLQSRKFIFFGAAGGRSQYAPLSPAYARAKRKKYGDRPILFASGRLAKSMTQRGGDNIVKVGKKTLEIGTRIPYGVFLQEGTRKMPPREFLFWGPESPRFSNDANVRKNLKNMAFILFNYINRKTGKALRAAESDAQVRVDEIFR